MHATLQSSAKAKNIVQSFIDSHAEGSHGENDDIFCPISQQIMVYPVDVRCGSNVPHTFEFFEILRWVLEKPECPTCRRAIDISQVDRNLEVEGKIHSVVGKIFIKMEAILQKLPKRYLGLDVLPNFFDAHNVSDLNAYLKRGDNFLSGEIEDIRKKINQPDTLTLEETVALGYFLIHQFNPLKKKIDKMFDILSAQLCHMRTHAEIDKDTYWTQTQKVHEWYSRFKIIPDECKIIKKLYSMQGIQWQ